MVMPVSISIGLATVVTFGAVASVAVGSGEGGPGGSAAGEAGKPVGVGGP